MSSVTNRNFVPDEGFQNKRLLRVRLCKSVFVSVSVRTSEDLGRDEIVTCEQRPKLDARRFEVLPPTLEAVDER